MPHSRPNLKPELYAELERRFPDRDTAIVDIGAGDGETGKRLRTMGYTNIDAIEIWMPWVEKFSLAGIYSEVLVEDVRTRTDFERWEVAILTDILEHLTPGEATELLEDLKTSGTTSFVIVPWLTPPGPWGGNPHEEHKQPDLTVETMLLRYPGLRLQVRDKAKGFYVGGA